MVNDGKEYDNSKEYNDSNGDDNDDSGNWGERPWVRNSLTKNQPPPKKLDFRAAEQNESNHFLFQSQLLCHIDPQGSLGGPETHLRRWNSFELDFDKSFAIIDIEMLKN
jgi:hypothetical protein